ncbi:MAG TPA: LuxR C-terminal-related transcriptional regulator, partial [Negativicutes bacterium]|nr:LuxR C-terminal-related transcriptional regulator [Negativicutes bacterium]
LSIPRSNVPIVPRQQLMRELDRSVRYKLTFVCAPAGYGKTTAVAEWVYKRKRKACWLSLDSEDNQSVLFCRYLFAATRSLCPAGTDRFPGEIGRDIYDSMSVAAAIIQGTAALQDDYYIVLDDYQAIEQPYIHDLLGCLLKSASDFLHLIIISRTELPAALSCYHLHSQIMELRTKDLQFQANEIAALCRSRNSGVTKEGLQNLERVTEGWVAGLHFAALDAGKGSDWPAGKNGLADNQYVADYLTNEAWEKYPGEVQEFLLQTSILDKFTAAACDAVTQGEQSQATLDFLKKSGAFLVAADEEGQWFRYHHLYREYLRKKLDNLHRNLLPELHRRAGLWFDRNNFPTEAIEQALQAKDYARVAEWIIEYAKGALGRGNTQNLSVWLNALPQTIIEANPLLGLAYIWTMLLSGRFEMYQLQLEKLQSQDLQSLGVPNDLVAKIKNELLLIRAAAASFVCDIDACLALNREAHGHGSIFMSQVIEFNSGEASILTRNVKIPLDRVLDFVLKMSAMWPGIGEPTGSWSVTLGELLYERDELDSALSVLVEGIGTAERTKTMGPFLAGFITLARIARAKGNLGWAFEIIVRAEEKIKEYKAGEWLRLLEAFQVWLRVNSNDVQGIAEWLKKYNELCRDSKSQRLEYEEIARARALQALGRFDESARLLQRCLIRAKADNRVPSLVVILTIQAIAHLKTGDSEGAVFSLKEALTIARRDGYLRSIIDEGAPVVAVLRHFLAAPLAQKDVALTDFAGTLLHLANRHVSNLKTSVRTCTQEHTSERLTQREHDMLRLLDAGQANTEIAEQTGVTVNTVKSHIRRLYLKLGVRNRVSAVKRARELQLL